MAAYYPPLNFNPDAFNVSDYNYQDGFITYGHCLDLITENTNALNSDLTTIENEISTLQNNTTGINYNSSTSTTALNNISTGNITFTGSLNGIGTTLFNYLSGLSSNIQSQFNNITQILTGMSYASLKTTFINAVQAGQFISTAYNSGGSNSLSIGNAELTFILEQPIQIIILINYLVIY